MTEGFAANLEGVDYAQAPSTPGLMEEPNVSSVKEGLVSDDHLEPEDQNLGEFVQIEGFENASSKSDLHNRDDAMDSALGAHLNHYSIVCAPAEGSSRLYVELEVNQTRVEGDLLSTSVTTEHDPADGTVGVLDGLDKVEDANKVVSCNNEEYVPSIDQINGEYDESLGVRLQETDDVEIIKNMQETHSNGKHIVSNAIHSLELPSALKSVNVDGQGCQGLEDPEVLNDNFNNEQMATACTSVLQTCNSHLSKPDSSYHDVGNSVVASDLQSADIVPLSSESLQRKEGFHASGNSTKVQGQECHMTGVVQSEENRTSEPALSGEIQADGGKREDQLDKAISNDNQCEDLNSSMISDLPAPEKLLFAPQRLLDRQPDLLVETPDKQVQEGDESGAGTKIFGKKRSFAESSLTVQSINSVESLGMTKSKRTVNSIPDDDDLLSSILVGRRSSVLKMKPTPPMPEVPSMKRARFSSRPTTLKRKGLMDDSMVLHGDTIRQQLTNTEDIRRMRKKAPCTRTEILMIQRQFWEEELFSEPVLTGMLAELSHLHTEAFDLSRTRVSENDDNNNAPVEALNDEDSAKQYVTQHSEIEGSTEPGSCRNGLDRQSYETLIQNDNRQDEDHFSSYDISNQEHMNGITDLADYRSLEHEHLGKTSEIEIDKVDAEVADITNHSAQGLVTSQREPVSGDIFEMPIGTVDQSDIMDKMIGANDFIQMDASNRDKIDTQLVEEVASLRDISNGMGLDNIEFVDHSAEQIIATGTESRTEGMPLEDSKAGAPIEVGDFHPEGSAPIDDNFSSVNVDQALDEIGNDRHRIHCEVGGLGVSSGCIDQISNHLCNEESKMDSTYLVGLDGDFKSTSMNGDYTVCEQADHQSTMDMQNTLLDHVTIRDCGDFQDDAFANDTEFLNVDDDEIGEDYEEGMPNAEDTRLLDNSGWSSRTRAVAKYLQTLFDKEARHGRKVLLMDSLLVGKTRKEASRMFFETLVLKTRDYVHVEQAKPFDNINIKPRAKLMKSDF
ncbi:sister chromatid cohesion 1 protein 4 isoform X2 [Hevea brasiliensis]|uniref:sister chromatid cohesion 1 protein 4 isoform X2 n=1 Tax=Hevea brasiliensis TaxID=3981 RepID=UPI0025FE97E0|nr:sister chromatid cohesion 1 protein 4 isoform X2 [Hevea brasiliensis]